ncbi:ClpXP protease specificity-enhancing factor [Burkholderiales bacterium]|nr:ClpXP protease specificity-enhancing factor [Burkholderiales bacterium]
MKTLVPTTSYLIRAIYDWCCDTSQTPYVSVRVSEASSVPLELVQDGEIVLNIGTSATRDLRIDNEAITFSARFDSVSREIFIVISDVKGIFSRESGQGLGFNVDEVAKQESSNTIEKDRVKAVNISSKQRLKIVK